MEANAMKRIIHLAVLPVLLTGVLRAESYHVDPTGDDANSGTSQATAWKTVERVNRQSLQPGDSVLFKSGGVWQGQLRPQGSGVEGKPIRLDRYGDGALPVIDMSTNAGAVVSLRDQDWWEIRHLDLRGSATNMPPGDRQGIHVQGLKAARTLRHIHITDCRISDLQGTLGYYSCGILVTAPGWQDARGADPRLSVADVVIASNDVRRVSRLGIFALVAGAWPQWTPGPVRHVEPGVKSFRHLGGRKFEITYEWAVNDTFDKNLHCFVHICDDRSRLRIQNDHPLPIPTSQWKPGVTLADGPYTLEIPAGETNTALVVLIGLYGGSARGDDRVKLQGVPGLQPGTIALGRLRVQREDGAVTGVAFEKETGDRTSRDCHWHGTPGRDIVVRGNTVEDLGGDAIMVIGADQPLIEHNTVRRTCLRTGAPDLKPHQGYNPHSAAVWLQNCVGGVMQFNDVSHTRRQPGNGDATAFDFDYNCFDCVVQYNVSRENDGGLLLIMGTARNNVARYNLCQNDRRLLYLQCDLQEENAIHNNVFHADRGFPELILLDPGNKRTVGARLRNNIFHATGAGRFGVLHMTGFQDGFIGSHGPAHPGIFEGNCFFGPWESGLPADSRPVAADPQFVAPGKGSDGLDSWRGYRLKPTSPCINAGVVITNHGGRDFWGNPLLDGKPDIGAHESRFSTNATP